MPTPDLTTRASCADDSDPLALTVQQARDAIRAALVPIQDEEQVAIRSALGRALAKDCVSPLDVPSHTNSAMDGYALAGSDLPREGAREYRVVATALAGQTVSEVCVSGDCVRIMTGAPMPSGTDTVVMQEQVEVLGKDRVRIDASHRAGQNVRQAGEDIAQGSRVFERGRLLTAADLGVLASLGFAELRVHRRPRVAFFSTGDELRSIGDVLAEGEIYDSNRYSLHAMLTEAGVDIVDLGVVADDRQALDDAFHHAARVADVVITSGGVSVGEADYTKEILDKLGDIAFWTIAMKPGRPLTFGRLGQAMFFGLPGNPVAVMLTFHQFVRPTLRYLASGNWPIRLVTQARSRATLRKRPGRFEFVRGILSYDEQGQLTVGPSGAQGSGVLTSMSRANCYVLLNEECAGVAEGDMVAVEPFSTVL
jgi:molybdopterin molybdotransferase